MTTNEFERDLNDQSGLKRPGRIDLRVLQNTADAGDGHPGVQRCFRNYLHEGGMEKDLDLIGYSIKGTNVNINNAELQQLSNIGSSIISSAEWEQIANIGSSVITSSIWSQLDNIEATTISPAQWGYVGGADQPVKQADSPTFVGLTLSADLVTSSTIDGQDIAAMAADLANQCTEAEAHAYVEATALTITGGLQMSGVNITMAGAETVDGVDISALLLKTTKVGDLGDIWTKVTKIANGELDLSALAQNIVFTGAQTVDGVDVSGIKLNSMPTAADGDITANTQKITNVVDPTSDQDASTKKYTDDNDVWYKESDDLVFSNDPENNRSSLTYVKVKEIKCYIHANIRLYWEHYRQATSDTGYTRVYLNGVAVSTERSATTGYTPETHDMRVAAGDLLQIWGWAQKNEPLDDRSIYVQYMRIKYIDFISNDP